MNTRFRSKVVEIDAFQMTQERANDNSDWPDWLNEAWNTDPDQPGALYFHNRQAAMALCVNTREGEHQVSLDDWIIRGLKGELYVCKPDVFAMKYEPIE